MPVDHNRRGLGNPRRERTAGRRTVRRRHPAAVHQDGEPEGAHQPAPGPLADEGPHLELAPHPPPGSSPGEDRPFVRPLLIDDLLSLIPLLFRLLLIVPFLGMPMGFVSGLPVAAVLFLIAFGLTGLGFIIAWRMDSTQGFHAIMNLFLIPLWLLSGALFPAAGAAGWLSVVMRLNPLSYGIDALRHALYLQGHSSTAELSSFPVSLGVTVLFAAATFITSTLIVKQTRSA